MPFETVFIGVVIALLYTELTGIFPGGIVVPAFLALTLDRPVRALVTIAVACLSVLVFRSASRYLILFGRRRFVVMLLLGGLGAQALCLAAPHLFRPPRPCAPWAWSSPVSWRTTWKGRNSSPPSPRSSR